MLLTEFHVRNFRNFLDSTPIPVEDGVTCLVGKNESGKTAMLQALYRLNPAFEAGFDLERDYPRWLLVRDRRRGLAGDAVPIRAVFSLEPEDRSAIEAAVGPGVVAADRVAFSRSYGGALQLDVTVDEAAAVANLLERLDVGIATRQALAGCATFAALRQMVEERRAKLAVEGLGPELLEAQLAELDLVEQGEAQLLKGGNAWQVVARLLSRRLPIFFYFDDYSILPGRVDLRDLGPDAATPLTPALQTARALLELAATDADSLGSDVYEIRKAELEAVSNELTREVFEYWSQNQDLSVDVDIDQRRAADGIVQLLEVRVRDQRHGFTTNFGQRSSGFQWFFSFLAAFSRYEERDGRVVVLLDEPGLALHARAQADFLRFISERLAPSRQVLYTTHSPFMVQPGQVDRVRVSEDRGPALGTVVSSTLQRADRDSIFPLQAALGYEIAQGLFSGGNRLLVETTADFTYLTVLSDFLNAQQRTGLERRWRLAPTGGSLRIFAFASLLARAELDVTVLVDAGQEGLDPLLAYAGRGLLDGRRLVAVGDVTGHSGRAGIEDVFSEGDYLQLFNGAFGRGVKVRDLPPGPRITARIAALDGRGFDRTRPADYLLRHRDRLCAGFRETTLSRFEHLCERINATRATVGRSPQPS
jgi:AAA domain, putative AbiEii toxin, Type IV TA system/AAA ATPase domain